MGLCASKEILILAIFSSNSRIAKTPNISADSLKRPIYARNAPRVCSVMDQIAVVVSISGLNCKTIHIL